MSHDQALIYLDHNATTPVAPEVLDAMLPYLRDQYGNPSSDHPAGRAAARAVAAARARVAALIGADPDEIIFTSGGTESNNLAIRGTGVADPTRGRCLPGRSRRSRPGGLTGPSSGELVSVLLAFVRSSRRFAALAGCGRLCAVLRQQSQVCSATNQA